MPIPRWLRSFTTVNPPQTESPPPPRGGGGAPNTPDTSHRIHIAANDPAFPAKREAAVALITQAITDIAAPLGYTCKGTTWSRTSTRGRSAINLQRSRYGFTAHINLRFLRPDGTAPQSGIWGQNDDIRIQRFYLPGESVGDEGGVLTYLDVSENPSTLNLPMQILATRALPWLDAHHTAHSLPEIEDFLPG